MDDCRHLNSELDKFNNQSFRHSLAARFTPNQHGKRSTLSSPPFSVNNHTAILNLEYILQHNDSAFYHTSTEWFRRRIQLTVQRNHRNDKKRGVSYKERQCPETTEACLSVQGKQLQVLGSLISLQPSHPKRRRCLPLCSTLALQ